MITGCFTVQHQVHHFASPIIFSKPLHPAPEANSKTYYFFASLVRLPIGKISSITQRLKSLHVSIAIKTVNLPADRMTFAPP
jgi:hypothetical protein